MSTNHFANIFKQCDDIAAVDTAVVYPCEETALQAALEAGNKKYINPILVGPESKIRAVAETANIDLNGHTIIDAPNGRAAAKRSVEMVHEGKIGMLLKGSLHTDELLGAVASSQTGLRTNRRLSHVFAMSVDTYHKPLFVTDAVVNIEPSLEHKYDICRNAIELVQALGVQTPKLAILSAVENINPKIQTTLDAAALVMMSHRQQINGAIIDGPLAFDNAISAEAARIKGIVSEVAGDPDILLAPNLECGNIMFKQMVYLSNALAAGIVLGAKVPVALTSRADSAAARLASCAMCALVASKKAPK